MKTIYNVAVLMDSQETCNRMKKLCLDNGLTYWGYEDSFEYVKQKFEYFVYAHKFLVTTNEYLKFELVTESEFIELLKNNKG
jgi:hypothetical protein